jgi:lipooligosaccharide transport system ATP-binding protein
MRASPIHIEHLHKFYGDLHIVNDLSLSVERGECYGLLGPNGAGKTTTLRMLLGITVPDRGNISLCSEPIPLRARHARAQIGVIPQFDNLDPDFTVRENLLVYGRYFGIYSKKLNWKIDELLSFVHLEHKIDAKVGELSGGMKRRLSLARALVNDPDVLILDEPTTGLDPQARHLIWERLRSLVADGKTILITTHFMEEAERLCDRVCIIENGTKVVEGSPRALIDAQIGCDVIEIYGNDLGNLRRTLEPYAEHIDLSGDTLFCYVSDTDPITMRLHGRHDIRYLHRPANLEDVFLRLTGRELTD